MKLLTIIGTNRRNGGLYKLSDALHRGAMDANNTFEALNLFDYTVKPCKGCLSCTLTKQCSRKDDFDLIYDKMSSADVIVMIAPVFCHNVPGIMKNFMDRCCSKVIPFVRVDKSLGLIDRIKKVSEYQTDFKNNAPFKDKLFIVLTASSTPGKNNKDIKTVSKHFSTFIKEEMKGTIIGEIRLTDTLFKFRKNRLTKLLKDAYTLGYSLDSSRFNTG